MKHPKGLIKVFNQDTNSYLGGIQPEQIESFYRRYRRKGYSICVDIDDDIFISKDDDDDGKSYLEQIQDTY